MWDSPIKIIYKDIDMQLEAGVIKAVQKASIYVDKDELRKALQYDREQYRKGYEDAVLDKTHGKWEMIDSCEPIRYGCSNCKILSWDTYNYCPNCGAKMDEREDEE